MSFDTETLTPDDFADSAAAVMDACAGRDLGEAAAALGEAGMTGILAGEAVGGLGLPMRYAVPVLTTAGARRLEVPLLEALLVARALESVDAALAADVVTGGTVATVAWDGALSLRPGGAFRVDGCVGGAIAATRCGVVLAATEDGAGVLLRTGQAGVTVEEHPSLDVDRRACIVTCDGADVPAGRIVPAEAMTRLALDASIGRAAIAIGCADAAMAMTVEHTTTRKQFGKTLAANQSLRHALARQLMNIEGARALLRMAAARDAADPTEARAAEVEALRGAVETVEKAIQLHGGMGFTWEVPLHRYLRWVRDLQAQGNVDAALLALGTDFIAARAAASAAAPAAL
ncbi:acyl-CoA dehydrogenase [Acuticoccus sediminis]|uniref:Acyl-CoA dehydrogenase n=1 Tax=Acuticoccus sediminis TaxID=2184697 RepID=A0A8B2P2H7_9HYPH|nr:acyl-CoA dehydrogenase family protein [Acuticoccus sediminis]RAI02467.1 acyl-CoA dehydrogenase [Acuticoccus sediminis]